MKDRLFHQPLARTAGFEFDQAVADVFDDMLDRSIPFYAEVQKMICDFVAHFYMKDAVVYDLGCSTGRMLALLAEQIPDLKGLVGVDNSKPMIDKARANLAKLNTRPPIDLRHADLRETAIENAGAVIMNYTLQFIRPLNRPAVVRDIYEALNPGGVLLLSEKVWEKSTAIGHLFTDMYYDFKREHGYSELEISQKRERLEHVLIPYHIEEQEILLKNAGFQEVALFFKWHNFASFIAIKSP